MTVRGVRGSIRWGYHRAAEVRAWCVSRDKTTKAWSLTGAVVEANPFLGSRSALVFVVPLKGGHAWQWPIETLAIAGGRLTATLGPMDTARAGEGVRLHA